ncbi:hypothetical protein D3C73_1221010 [compost metagenome]
MTAMLHSLDRQRRMIVMRCCDQHCVDTSRAEQLVAAAEASDLFRQLLRRPLQPFRADVTDRSQFGPLHLVQQRKGM